MRSRRTIAAKRMPFPGYGHPLHKDADPRAARLLAVAEEAGLSGTHAAAAMAAEQAILEITGKTLVLNVSGAIPAVLLDAGFPDHRTQGRADPGARGKPGCPSGRGADAADRLPAVGGRRARRRLRRTRCRTASSREAH